MTVREALRLGAARLEKAGIPDPRLDGEYLLAHVLGRPRLAVCLAGDEALTPAAADAYRALLARREEREPLQYILGDTGFYGRSFRCDPRALIPRPETELLCEQAFMALKILPQPAQVLDLCCGTGAIGLTLALEAPACRVTLTDLSHDALSLCRENAARLNASAAFCQGDLFEGVGGAHYHLIVSNPPYIPEAVCPTLQAEVLREPLLALDGGKDGLDFYRRIAREAPGHLLPGGFLMLEIGFDQGESVPALLADCFTDIRLHHDLSRLPRMVTARLK